jgi:hypothetical protein
MTFSDRLVCAMTVGCVTYILTLQAGERGAGGGGEAKVGE